MKTKYSSPRLIVLIFIAYLFVPQNGWAQSYTCGSTFGNLTTDGSRSYTFTPTSGYVIDIVNLNTGWNIPTGHTMTIQSVAYTSSTTPPASIVSSAPNGVITGIYSVGTSPGSPAFSSTVSCRCDPDPVPPSLSTSLTTICTYTTLGASNFTVSGGRVDGFGNPSPPYLNEFQYRYGTSGAFTSGFPANPLSTGTLQFRARLKRNDTPGCTSGWSTTVQLTVISKPAAAGTISGYSSVCPGQTGVSYSVATITGATSYIWSYSGSGATFSGSTNPVTVNFASNATSGNITVFGRNSCGDGTVSSPFAVTIYPAPDLFNVTGGGNYCSNSSGAPVGLDGSQSGVNYQLYVGGSTPVGSPLPGTGSALSFGYHTAGTYTVVGTNATTNCSRLMSGNAVPVSSTLNSQTFTTSGTFTPMYGVTQVTIECWGGGARGGNSNQNGGGGGGAYSKLNTYTVTPGISYPYTVGSGGNNTTPDGGDTYFVNNTTVLAKGGKTTTNSTGGQGGQLSGGIGDTKHSGGQGGSGGSFAVNWGGAGGSSAGTDADGVTASDGGSTPGTPPSGAGSGGRGALNAGILNYSADPGTSPGGGGGGRAVSSYIQADGASGQIIISWSCSACTNGTWLGTTSSSWNNGANWCGGVPNGSTYAIIPDASTTPNDPVVDITNATCYDLTIQTGGTISIGAGSALTVNGTLTNSAGTSGLVIESSSEGATGTGSLFISSAVQATVKRYMSEDVWHIVSSPVSDQGIPAFLTNAGGNPITSYGAPYNDYDMIWYVESTDDWSDYYPNKWSETTMGIAKGYSVVPTLNSAAIFTGTLNAGNISIPITRSGKGWNCIGNPYPAAISVTTFLTHNSNANGNLIDNSYKALYLWDEGTGYAGTTFEYVALSNVGVNLPWVGDRISQSQVALGQGFIIRKATSGSANITFDPAMRVISTDAVFKDATVPWPALQLFAEAGDKELKSNTILAFNEEMTKGLDPGYDVGMLKANPDFALYTRLLENDQGIDFAIQSLSSVPGDENNAFLIPVGLDYKEGGEVTFTARVSGFSQGTSIYLEDRLMNKTTNLFESGARYAATLNPGTAGTGRFYLKAAAIPTSTPMPETLPLKVYTQGGRIVIDGSLPAGSRLALYSAEGRCWYSGKTDNLSRNLIDATGFPPGVYILDVNSGQTRVPYKVALGINR